MTDEAKSPLVTCTSCGRMAAIPADRDHRPLWRKGWRWIGGQGLFSCPACPPVVVEGGDGKHYRPKPAHPRYGEGPGIERVTSTPGPPGYTSA